MGFKKILSLAALSMSALALDVDKDEHRKFQQIVFNQGYAMEHYSLVTSDDYILTLYRIPGKFSEAASNRKSKVQNGPKPAVLMLHSQDWDMTQWVSNDYDRAQAFTLSEAGYDVWMGNNRGSAYSRGHLKYTKKDYEFW